jgi:hypothetical protein
MGAGRLIRGEGVVQLGVMRFCKILLLLNMRVYRLNSEGAEVKSR